MQTQPTAGQISQAQYELIGRLAFENAVLKGEIVQLQSLIEELKPKAPAAPPNTEENHDA
jgi:hypothetical protein